MATDKRIVKLSVFKEHGLIEEATFHDKAEILLGSFARADLRLDDDSVERRQLLFRIAADGGVTVENVAGDEGPAMHGQEPVGAEPRPVGDGDEIRFGDDYRVIVALLDSATAAAAAPAAVEPEAAMPGATPALEVAMFWEGALLSVNHYMKLQTVTIGEAKGTEYFTPEERLKTRSYDLVVPHNGKFAVNLKSPGIEGSVRIGDKIYTTAELKAANLLTSGGLLPVDENTRCRLKLGNISFLVSHAMLPPKPRSAYFARMSFSDHIYTAISLIAHLTFMIILTLIPEEQIQAQRDPHAARSRPLQVLMKVTEERQEEEKKEEEPKEEEKRTDGDEKDADQTEPTPEKKIEVTSRKETPEIVSELQPHRLREYNRRVALSTGVSKAFDQQTDLIQQMMGSGSGLWGAGDRGLKVIMSRGAGDDAAGGYFTGSGGLDPFGGGGGGGGGGFRGTALASTLGGAAGPETAIAGLGKEEGRGSGRVRLRDRERRVVVQTSSFESGGYDRATIQRYIRSKMGQIRWCYRNELQKKPELAGKITIEFVISPTGAVLKPRIAATSMRSGAVEGCIISKVKLWRFPAPKSGGAAKVRYPFIFKAI